MSVRYQLETIPVREALQRASECLLCDLEAESERRNVEFFLGSSVMAPEMRVQVNEHGFCSRHFHLLGSGSGKLGYALALSTHAADLAQRLKTGFARIAAAGARRGQAQRATGELESLIRDQQRDCLMCDRIRRNLENYAFTIARLFETDEEFRAAFSSSKGLCLRHLPLQLRLGLHVLKPAELPGWHSALAELTERSMTRLVGELEEFTWQFDCTSERRTPDSAQDSVSRTVRKLSGFGPDRVW